MLNCHRTLAIHLLAALYVPLALAQEPAIKALLEQGRYWQSRENPDRAAEAWQKLLKVQPNLPEALHGMALAEAGKKRFGEAASYLAQLKKIAPSYPGLAQAEQSVTVMRNEPQLQTARDLAKAGKATDSITAYQGVLGNQVPRGPLALEYFQTLGGTAQGWDAARKGLEQLSQDNPDDARISLALAQHLTYRESTRREGIAQLSRLASHPEVGSVAAESWRKALAWTGSRVADIPLYRQFLRAFPGDAAVQSRLDDIERQLKQARTEGTTGANDPARKRTQESFRALDDGELDAAEAGFRGVLETRQNDGDALGGMGVLRLRQENFSQARDYLERASRQGQASRWKSALDSANYWLLVAQSNTARESNNVDAARLYLQQAVRLDPRETTAEIDLADVLVELGQYDTAEATYRRVLARQSDNPDAIRGLVGVLAQNNKADEALRIIERMSPTQQEKVGALGRLRATHALGQAKAASERGDDTGARVALEDALLHDPANAWVRLDLARLYLKLDAKAEARGIMDGLLISNPNMPEALYAHALLSTETQDWATALATLERVPEANRTRDIAALYKRVWVHVQAQGASALVTQGRHAEALAKLAQAEPFAGQDPELLGAMAMAYTDAGDANRAMATIRQLLARSAKPEPGLRLQYAAILLKTNQDVELAGLLRQLQGMPMTRQQRQAFEELRVGYVIRQAESLRSAGDLAAAYDTLSPVLAERPNDPVVLGALARMYAANNDYVEAINLYNRLLEKDPNNLQLLLPAASLATSAKEFPYAESAIQIALVRAPNDPEVLTAAARLYRAQGKTAKATEFFTAAVAAENQQRNAQLAASGSLVQIRSSNPFLTRNNAGQRQPFTPLTTAVPSAVPMGTATGQITRIAGGDASRITPLPLSGYPSTASLRASPAIPEPGVIGRSAVMTSEPLSRAHISASGGGGSLPSASSTPATYQSQAYQPTPLELVPSSTASKIGAKASRTTSAQNTIEPGTVHSQRSSAAAKPTVALSTDASSTIRLGSTTRAYDAQAIPDPAPLEEPSLLASSTNAQAWSPFAPQKGTRDNVARTQRNNLAPGNVRRSRTGAVEELHQLDQDRIATVSVGAIVRARHGESGISQLTDIETPIQLRFDAGDGKVVVGITPTVLNAGTASTAYATSSRFGGGPVSTRALPGRSVGDQSASGVGLGLGYESGNFNMDVGATPVGFKYADVTAGVKYSFPINDQLTLVASGARRPVTDSLLSFAGTTDARSGDSWGGVSATGGRLELGWNNYDFGLYTYGGLYSLTGVNVAMNSRTEGGAGLNWYLERSAHSTLTTGVSLTAQSYEKNLSYFTYGHGGYFSPQTYLSLNVPMEWSQRDSRHSVQVKGSVGFEAFREDAAPYFPTSASRQSAAAQAAMNAYALGTIGASDQAAIYPGQSKTGLRYSLGAAMEYQLHPQLFAGGQFAVDNAGDYRQFTAGIYLRYALQPFSGPQALPVNPLRSPY